MISPLGLDKGELSRVLSKFRKDYKWYVPFGMEEEFYVAVVMVPVHDS